MTVAGYTYKGLQNEVLEFQFNENKYRPLVKTWLNQAVRQIVISAEIRTREAEETITTTANDNSYALPATFSRFIDLFYPTTHELLSPMDIPEFDGLPESEGRPYAYTARGSELFLYPTPNAVYSFTLRYWKLPADMVNDEDVPEIPAQYQQLPVSYAMWKAYLRENDYQAAKVWQELWNEGLLKMRGEAQGDMFDGPRQVGGSWGDQHNVPPSTAWR